MMKFNMMMKCQYQTIVLYMTFPKEDPVKAKGPFYSYFAPASLCKLRCFLEKFLDDSKVQSNN